MTPKRDHGGGLDIAIARYGGNRADWMDLSTGINPIPYPVGEISDHAWTALPDSGAESRLIQAARNFWQVPAEAMVLPVHGASAAIARIPSLLPAGRVRIDSPTYNEHAAAFRAAGWRIDGNAATARVIVHPNNPTGALWDGADDAHELVVVDESFCDVAPEHTHIHRAKHPNTIILKSFGKFWGLAGLRLGFAIGAPDLINRLKEALGPWSVSGPALEIATRALGDSNWAAETRARLIHDTDRLDRLLVGEKAALVGGTSLFRLYQVQDAKRLHDELAQRHVLTRIFPYSQTWIRFGLPAPDQWSRLEAVL